MPGQLELPHGTTGRLYLWLVNGLFIQSGASPTTADVLDWQIQDVQDLNRYGKADNLWRHQTSNILCVRLTNGTACYAWASPGAVSNLDRQILKYSRFCSGQPTAELEA